MMLRRSAMQPSSLAQWVRTPVCVAATVTNRQPRSFATSSRERSSTKSNAEKPSVSWEEALCRLREPSSPPTIRDYTVAISACADAKQWAMALQLLSDMEIGALTPTKITYNAVMNACAKAAQWQRAGEILEKMHRAGVSPDVVSYSTALNACAKAGQWQNALMLIDAMQDNNVQPNTISYNACISALGKSEGGAQWQRALTLLHAIKPTDRTVVSYSAAISACEKAGQWVDALRLLNVMEKGNIAPNVIAYGAAISACGRAAEWIPAMTIFNRMLASRVKKDVVVFNAAMTACANASMWMQTLAIMQKMEKMKIQADAISYNVAIAACGNAGKWRPAKQLLQTMEETAHITPTIRTYNSVLSAYENRRKWQQALDMFAHMQQKNVAPDVISYNCAISACEKAGKWVHALGMLAHMDKNAVAPTVVSYSAVMSACVPGGMWKEAVQVMSRMLDDPSVKPNVHAFSAAIGACVRGGEAATALALLAHMKEIGCAPDAIAYTEVWKACEESNPTIQNEVCDAAIQWAQGSNPAFVKGPHDAMQLLIALGQHAPPEFTKKVRDWVFDPTVLALRGGDVEALRQFGLPNFGPFTREALETFGIATFDATDARKAVALNSIKSDDVRAREILAHIKTADVDRVVKYGSTSLSRALPSVFLRQDRSDHAERQALLQVMGTEGPVELYVTHRPCVSCIAAMVAFQAENGNLKVVFDEMDGE